ncbi:MAG: glycine cleavage system protein GcvH [Alphaproteobacteria bacterium]
MGTVGISDFAQEALGDVVFVELPEAGRQLSKGAEVAVVESVKAANEIYAPVSGEIIEVNGELENDTSLVNSDPTGKGWFFRIRLSDATELDGMMDEAAYKAFAADAG